MKKIVITAIGKDKPGIVSSVTGVFYHHHASIEDSTMTILEENFAMIMIVALPEHCVLSDCQRELKKLESKSGLAITVRTLRQEPQVAPFKHRGKPFIISVLGSDRPGIVYRVSKLLAQRKINITDLNTKVIGREGNKNVYAMVIEVEIPSSLKHHSFQQQLKRLGKTMAVDITFRSLENLNL